MEIKDIKINGTSYNWGIRQMAQEAKVSDMMIIRRARKLGIEPVTFPYRKAFTEEQAEKIINFGA